MEELTKNQAIIEVGIKELLKSTSKSQDEVLRILLEKLKQVPTSGGRFVWNETNIQLLNSITPLLQEAIAESGIDEDFAKYFEDFDEIGKNLQDLHERVNKINVPKSIIKAEQKIMVDRTVQGLAEANIDLYFFQPVKQSLYNKIRFGASVTETEQYLRDTVTGANGKKGIYDRWAGQVARDSANQYEGQVNKSVAIKFDLKNWLYVGPLIKDSRPQCVRWVGKGLIKESELENEIVWAEVNGTGLIPGTDVETWPINRGGYNCIHTAIPTV